MTEIFDKVLEKLPKCMSIMVAGGAAADFDLAGDIDVFIGNNKEGIGRTFMKTFPYYREMNHNQQYDGTGNMLIAEVFDPEITYKPIQIIVGVFKSPLELVNSFDISTHQVAYDKRGVTTKGDKWTPTTAHPVIVRPSAKTLYRYVKICNRYGHIPDSTVLKGLMAKAPKFNYATYGDDLLDILGKVPVQ